MVGEVADETSIEPSEWQFNCKLALESLLDFEKNILLMCGRFRKKYKTMKEAKDCRVEIIDSLKQAVLTPNEKEILLSSVQIVSEDEILKMKNNTQTKLVTWFTRLTGTVFSTSNNHAIELADFVKLFKANQKKVSNPMIHKVLQC